MNRYLKIGLLSLYLSIGGCRQDNPPVIELCGMKTGLAFCVLKDGTKVKRLPSTMDNYQCLPRDDFEAFVSWAYNPPKTAETEE